MTDAGIKHQQLVHTKFDQSIPLPDIEEPILLQ